MADSRAPNLAEPLPNHGLIGQAPRFRLAVNLIRQYAAWDAPVLIEGETGTGKELAARGIHYCGGRRAHRFIPVNCGAIPENLIENELFGHVRGAFTDASVTGPGLVRLAHQGTLFLDEVDALPPRGQVALLRFLQDGCYRPLGARQEETADVRIVVASNRKLQGLVEERCFRADLMFRLHVLTLEMPPPCAKGPETRYYSRSISCISLRCAMASPCHAHWIPARAIGWMNTLGPGMYANWKI
ncbi:sigma-54 factor interaction domain-containing protein [Ralstonia solanacearum]|uniref:sigma-54 factor interaction domain-containing protein n=1 Tax=Ralstonia solanacearum TaxID=305 RepID=UPI002174DBF9|nr:sigma-54 factor interaction domain-containing protein [Ralstonia solanacearum]